MRQAGVLAAAAHVALDEAKVTLQKNHKDAKTIAQGQCC